MIGHPGLPVQWHVDMVRGRGPSPVGTPVLWQKLLNVTWSPARVIFYFQAYFTLTRALNDSDFYSDLQGFFFTNRLIYHSLCRWCQHCGRAFPFRNGKWHRAFWNRWVFIREVFHNRKKGFSIRYQIYTGSRLGLLSSVKQMYTDASIEFRLDSMVSVHLFMLSAVAEINAVLLSSFQQM